MKLKLFIFYLGLFLFAACNLSKLDDCLGCSKTEWTTRRDPTVPHGVIGPGKIGMPLKYTMINHTWVEYTTVNDTIYELPMEEEIDVNVEFNSNYLKQHRTEYDFYECTYTNIDKMERWTYDDLIGDNRYSFGFVSKDSTGRVDIKIYEIDKRNPKKRIIGYHTFRNY